MSLPTNYRQLDELKEIWREIEKVLV